MFRSLVLTRLWAQAMQGGRAGRGGRGAEACDEKHGFSAQSMFLAATV